jgi:hypothetical protein
MPADWPWAAYATLPLPADWLCIARVTLLHVVAAEFSKPLPLTVIAVSLTLASGGTKSVATATNEIS